jgi:hypothetical protein
MSSILYITATLVARGITAARLDRTSGASIAREIRWWR